MNECPENSKKRFRQPFQSLCENPCSTDLWKTNSSLEALQSIFCARAIIFDVEIFSVFEFSHRLFQGQERVRLNCLVVFIPWGGRRGDHEELLQK